MCDFKAFSLGFSLNWQQQTAREESVEALDLVPVEEFFLFGGGVAQCENHFASFSNLETILHHWLIGRDQLPRLLNYDSVSVVGLWHEFSTVSDVRTENSELPNKEVGLQRSTRAITVSSKIFIFHWDEEAHPIGNPLASVTGISMACLVDGLIVTSVTASAMLKSGSFSLLRPPN